jgi:aspartate/methionine/tyrosine aminotransferase
MNYKRMPIEVESPEEIGYSNIRYNLSESSIADKRLSEFGFEIPDLELAYNEHRGSIHLRELIVADSPQFSAQDVLVTAGAAGALFIVATTMLGPKDHLVVVRPNYATNLETPRAIGCDISFVDLSFENGFALDIESLQAAIKSNTKLISITSPHNPTGVILDESVLRQVLQICSQHNCHLLVDETYRELSFGGPASLAASLGTHVISVSSLSKAYGVPGIRLGWIICSDLALQEKFLAAKEQIGICGSTINDWIAEKILAHRSKILPPILREMQRRLLLVSEWIQSEELLEWVRPSGGVVCFPRMREPPAGGVSKFYLELMKNGIYVGPGHWFEMPDTYFRLGYGWPTYDQLESGLCGISKALHN